MKIKKDSISLTASPRAVIAQYLNLSGNHRISNMVKRVEDLDELAVNEIYKNVVNSFNNRHRHLEKIFSDHFDRIQRQYGKSLEHFSDTRRLLLGSFFTKEYSIQAAALFNPSIVSHPDQSNIEAGEHRFIMSLRATGEGHISSIIFQTGVINEKGAIKLDAHSGFFSPLLKKSNVVYSKKFLIDRIGINDLDKNILENLPDSFTEADALQFLKTNAPHVDPRDLIQKAEKIIDRNYELEDSAAIPFNEKVIFPASKAEQMGMEDVRLVKFNNGENSCYYGTYTAYDGFEIKTQLLETKDFHSFKIRSLHGAAISDKGMALFPEKINNQYVMISRQGGEKMHIMYSEDLYHWERFQPFMEPKYSWELLQLGNCGSPVKTAKGWLLLTHGVGPMRTYVISAILMDLEDPSKIIGRLKVPLLEADEKQREGYVPNVVYTCGYLLHNHILLIPYAVSDAATEFATVRMDELLNEMTTEI